MRTCMADALNVIAAKESPNLCTNINASLRIVTTYECTAVKLFYVSTFYHAIIFFHKHLVFQKRD